MSILERGISSLNFGASGKLERGRLCFRFEGENFSLGSGRV
jgi:hypothetical protein